MKITKEDINEALNENIHIADGEYMTLEYNPLSQMFTIWDKVLGTEQYVDGDKPQEAVDTFNTLDALD